MFFFQVFFKLLFFLWDLLVLLNKLKSFFDSINKLLKQPHCEFHFLTKFASFNCYAQTYCYQKSHSNYSVIFILKFLKYHFVPPLLRHFHFK